MTDDGDLLGFAILGFVALFSMVAGNTGAGRRRATSRRRLHDAPAVVPRPDAASAPSSSVAAVPSEPAPRTSGRPASAPLVVAASAHVVRSGVAWLARLVVVRRLDALGFPRRGDVVFAHGVVVVVASAAFLGWSRSGAARLVPADPSSSSARALDSVRAAVGARCPLVGLVVLVGPGLRGCPVAEGVVAFGDLAAALGRLKGRGDPAAAMAARRRIEGLA